MNDRELLDLAAKAAGAKWSDYSDKTPDHWRIKHADGVWRAWNPLTDDGDALRLMVALDLHPTLTSEGHIECWSQHPHDPEKYLGRGRCWFGEGNRRMTDCPGASWEPDRLAATRRAIVRAAAEIGKALHNAKFNGQPVDPTE